MAATERGPRPGHPPEPPEACFVADAMLGKLARWLRALGYDTLYLREAPDARLLALALGERRLLLTRDVRLARRARDAGLLIRADRLDEQLGEVAAARGLTGRAPLSRCLECNGRLLPADPASVRAEVPPYTFATQRAFRRCQGCGRVFWPGTHAAGILGRLRPFLAAPPGGAADPGGPPGAPRGGGPGAAGPRPPP
jgi:uncharacterized protein with PIN domain